MKFKKKNTDFEEDEIVVKKTKKSKKNEPVEEKNPFQKRKNSNESLNPLMNSFKAGNNNNETFVKKTNSSLIIEVAKALRNIFKVKNHPIKIIGVRHGEKIHETLNLSVPNYNPIKENIEKYLKICINMMNCIARIEGRTS